MEPELFVEKSQAAIQRLQRAGLMIAFDSPRSDLLEAMSKLHNSEKQDPAILGCCFEKQAIAAKEHLDAVRMREAEIERLEKQKRGSSKFVGLRGNGVPRQRLFRKCERCLEIDRFIASFRDAVALHFEPLVEGALRSVGRRLFRIPPAELNAWVHKGTRPYAQKCAWSFLSSRVPCRLNGRASSDYGPDTKDFGANGYSQSAGGVGGASHLSASRIRGLEDWERNERSFDAHGVLGILGFDYPANSEYRMGDIPGDKMKIQGELTAGDQEQDHAFQSGILCRSGCDWKGSVLAVGSIAICYRCDTEATIDFRCRCWNKHQDFPMLGDVTPTFLFVEGSRTFLKMRVCKKCRCENSDGTAIQKPGAPSMRVDRRLFLIDEHVDRCPICNERFEGRDITATFGRNCDVSFESGSATPGSVATSKSVFSEITHFTPRIWVDFVDWMKTVVKHSDKIVNEFCKSKKRDELQTLLVQSKRFFKDLHKSGHSSNRIDIDQDRRERLQAKFFKKLDSFESNLSEVQRTSLQTSLTQIFDQGRNSRPAD